MQKKIFMIGLVLVVTGSLQVYAQNDTIVSKYRKWFVGSSLFMLGNFDKTNNPKYVQINFGYRITPKDVLSLDFKKSVYSWPLLWSLHATPCVVFHFLLTVGPLLCSEQLPP